MDISKIDIRENLLDGSYEITNQVVLYFKDGQKVHVKILRGRNGKYFGESSHSLKTSNQLDGYQASHPCDTPEEAINDVIRGFNSFYNKEDLEDNKWIPEEF